MLDIDPVQQNPNSVNDKQWDRLKKALDEFSQDEKGLNFPDDRSAEYYQAAQTLLSHGEVTSARLLLRKIIFVAPYSAPTIKALAECAGRLGEHEERLKLLKLLIGIDLSAASLLAYADALYEFGFEQDALKNYLQASELAGDAEPMLFHIYKSIGNIFARSGDFESAEENYNKAHVIDGQSAVLRVNFGTLAIQKNDWELAKTNFRAALRIDEKNDQAWVGLALVHRHCGDHSLGWGNVLQALDLNPDNQTALQLALNWVVTDRKWQDVTFRLQKFLDRNGENPSMSLALAQLQYVQGNFTAAQLEVTRVLALEPNFPGAIELQHIIAREMTAGSRSEL